MGAGAGNNMANTSSASKRPSKIRISMKPTMLTRSNFLQNPYGVPVTSQNRITPPTAITPMPYIKNIYRVRLDQWNYRKESKD